MFNKFSIIPLFFLLTIFAGDIQAFEKTLAQRTGTGSSTSKGKRYTESQYINALKDSAINIHQFMEEISGKNTSDNNSNNNGSNDQTYPSNNSNPQITPDQSDSDGWISGIPNQDLFSANVVQGASSCLKNQAVYRQVERETGLSWQMVAGVHFVEGSCGSTSSCYSGRIFGELEPDMGNSCTKHARKVAGGCVFDNLLGSCIDGAIHYINKIGRIPKSLSEYATAADWYNGTGNENCVPGISPYTWCPAKFTGEDHTHAMTWFNGDIACQKNPNAKYCLYKIYCSDGGKCPYGTRQERLGSVTVAKILGLSL